MPSTTSAAQTLVDFAFGTLKDLLCTGDFATVHDRDDKVIAHG